MPTFRKDKASKTEPNDQNQSAIGSFGRRIPIPTIQQKPIYIVLVCVICFVVLIGGFAVYRIVSNDDSTGDGEMSLQSELEQNRQRYEANIRKQESASTTAAPGSQAYKDKYMALTVYYIGKDVCAKAIEYYELYRNGSSATDFDASTLESIAKCYLRLGNNAAAIDSYRSVIERITISEKAGDFGPDEQKEVQAQKALIEQTIRSLR